MHMWVPIWGKIWVLPNFRDTLIGFWVLTPTKGFFRFRFRTWHSLCQISSKAVKICDSESTRDRQTDRQREMTQVIL